MAKKSDAPVAKGNVALERLTIDYVSPNELKPNDYNPNRQADSDFELLCKSIDEDGFTQPVVAIRSTKVIVDGEHRWRAAMALGIDPIPVVFTDMSPEQARIATLRHNRARGEEDVELAAAVLRDLVSLGATDWLKDSLNLDDVEFENFMEAVDEQESFSTAEATRMAEASEPELRKMVEDEGGHVEEHQTASVQDVIRARQKKISEAKTEQERMQIEHESDVYRLRFVFDGEEGALVKRVLGQKPVERLISLCRERAAS